MRGQCQLVAQSLVTWAFVRAMSDWYSADACRQVSDDAIPNFRDSPCTTEPLRKAIFLSPVFPPHRLLCRVPGYCQQSKPGPLSPVQCNASYLTGHHPHVRPPPFNASLAMCVLCE